ncbi:MAG: nucleotidyl transferase AbiEii/AbiGii toxin family protein [Bryobacteraceae bacterium]
MCARRRESNHDAAFGSLAEIQKIVAQIRAAWPEVKIILRGDSGFCRNELMSWCEDNRVDFVFGLARNQRLRKIIGRDWLGFAGIESSRVSMISREQQFAEKVQAYTLPRNNANSRVKDLVDLALLIGSGGLHKSRILDALLLTFERRGTDDLPAGLAPPPADWQIPFQALAKECAELVLALTVKIVQTGGPVTKLGQARSRWPYSAASRPGKAVSLTISWAGTFSRSGRFP